MKKIDTKHSNKIANSLLKVVALSAMAVSLLAACGQRGSLYIPTAPETVQRTTIVESLTPPTATAPPTTTTSSDAPKK